LQRSNVDLLASAKANKLLSSINQDSEKNAFCYFDLETELEWDFTYFPIIFHNSCIYIIS